MTENTKRFQTQWTVDGFMQAFEEMLKVEPGFYKAYELTEQQHQALFNHRRYSNYDSFRMSRKANILRMKKS